MSNTTVVRSGLCEMLTIVFVILKLTGVIHWSWWWVFAPIWIPVLLVLAVCAVILLGWIVYKICFNSRIVH